MNTTNTSAVMSTTTSHALVKVGLVHASSTPLSAFLMSSRAARPHPGGGDGRSTYRSAVPAVRCERRKARRGLGVSAQPLRCAAQNKCCRPRACTKAFHSASQSGVLSPLPPGPSPVREVRVRRSRVELHARHACSTGRQQRATATQHASMA